MLLRPKNVDEGNKPAKLLLQSRSHITIAHTQCFFLSNAAYPNVRFCHLVEVFPFAAGDDLKSLFFATARATRKYANIKADTRVTVLIDNRSNQQADFSKAAVVTATSKAQEVGESERELISATYLAKHPMLEEFVRSPSYDILKVQLKRTTW